MPGAHDALVGSSALYGGLSPRCGGEKYPAAGPQPARCRNAEPAGGDGIDEMRYPAAEKQQVELRRVVVRREGVEIDVGKLEVLFVLCGTGPLGGLGDEILLAVHREHAMSQRGHPLGVISQSAAEVENMQAAACLEHASLQIAAGAVAQTTIHEVRWTVGVHLRRWVDGSGAVHTALPDRPPRWLRDSFPLHAGLDVAWGDVWRVRVPPRPSAERSRVWREDACPGLSSGPSVAVVGELASWHQNTRGHRWHDGQ